MTRIGPWLCLVSLLAACGLEPKPETAKAELDRMRATAEKATRLSELQQQAYTRNTTLRFSAAEQDYRETLSLARELFPTDPARASSLRLNLALNKSNLGQFEAAEALFDQSRATLGTPDDRVRGEIFYAQHLMNLKQWTRAETMALAAADELRAMIDSIEQGIDALPAAPDPVVVRADGAVLVDEAKANRINTASDRVETPISERREISERDRLRLLRVQARYIAARAMQVQGRPWSEISPLLDLAEKDFVSVPAVYGRWLRAEVGSLRAEQHVAEGRPDLAIAELDQALAMLRAFELNSRPESLLLFKKGEILIESGQNAEGQAAFRDALKIVREDEQGLDAEQAQSVIDQVLFQAQAGDTAAQAELFEVMQKVRSSATAQTLAQLSARLASGDSGTAAAIREVQNLEREVNILAARLDRLEADKDADLHFKRVTEGRLGDSRAALEAARARLKEIAPGYDQLVDEIIPLTDAQALLKDGEVMAAIQLGADKGLVVVLSNLSFDAYEIPMNVTIAEEEVRALREPIDGDFLLRYDAARAHDLFRTLFGPVARRVAEAEHLIVVPTGPLMSLPFNALVTEPYDTEVEIVFPTDGTDPYFDYSKVKFLGGETGITTAVSISSFFLGRRVGPSQASKPFRGYGDFLPYGERPDVVQAVLTERGLPETCAVSITALGLLNALPGTRDELTKIAGILDVPDADIVLGDAFSDREVKETPLSDYKVLHFATHGLLAQSPECLPEPGLVTSLGQGSDNLLEASEIVELGLDAELVVMSACDTAAGAGVGSEGLTGFRGVGGSYAAGGESLSGLARSFFFAGARNVVSSHWSVDDAATQELMVAFYGAAREGDTSIAEAMRSAQKAQIDGGRLSHPFYWAPFATIGDGSRTLALTSAPAGDAPAAPAGDATQTSAGQAPNQG